jgi:NADH-quinone oxidoreductase subunit L
VGGAYWVFVMQKGEPARAFVEKFPGFHALVKDKWRIDELYEETFIGAVDALAEVSVWFDKWIVDGLIARFSAFIVSILGTVLRYAQTGRVQAYAFVMVLGLGWVGWFFFAPHADARITNDHATGAYSVAATPGPGYSYRWDADGNGDWDSKGYGDKRELKFDLDVNKTRKVRFEVRNAFGRTATSELSFTRPPQDLSGASAAELKAAGDASARPNPRRPSAAPEMPVGQ